jgi:hypothetical protein
MVLCRASTNATSRMQQAGVKRGAAVNAGQLMDRDSPDCPPAATSIYGTCASPHDPRAVRNASRPLPRDAAPQVFDANNNGTVDAGEWQRGLGDLGAKGEGVKRWGAAF